MNSERPSGPWEPRECYLGVEYVWFDGDEVGEGKGKVAFWQYFVHRITVDKTHHTDTPSV